MDLIAAQAARQPHRPALIEDERSLTWEQFFRMRNRLAHALAALGIGAGQHAIVYAHNALENLVVGAALRASSTGSRSAPSGGRGRRRSTICSRGATRRRRPRRPPWAARWSTRRAPPASRRAPCAA